MAWSSPRWTGKVPILRCTCSGTLTHSYNVPNDRTIGPSSKGVRNKQQATGVGRQWLLASLQSAQSACQSTAAVRDGEHSRPSPSPQRCSRCIVRLPHIEADVEQRLAAIRRAWSKDSCLSVCLDKWSASVNLGMHDG